MLATFRDEKITCFEKDEAGQMILIEKLSISQIATAPYKSAQPGH